VITQHDLVGGWPTPLKNDGVRQLGWWHSQLNGQINFMFQTTKTTGIVSCLWCWTHLDITTTGTRPFPMMAIHFTRDAGRMHWLWVWDGIVPVHICCLSWKTASCCRFLAHVGCPPHPFKVIDCRFISGRYCQNCPSVHCDFYNHAGWFFTTSSTMHPKIHLGMAWPT
jgi:hypothetical protein